MPACQLSDLASRVRLLACRQAVSAGRTAIPTERSLRLPNNRRADCHRFLMEQERTHMNIRKTLSHLAAAGLALMSSLAHAESWYSGYSSPFAVSGHAEWDSFTSASGNNAPDAGTNLSGAWLKENTGAGFLTSGLNLYSFAAAMDFTIYAPTASGTGTRDVVLRLQTLGTPLDLGSVTLGGVAYDSYSLLDNIALGGFGGSGQQLVFVWNDVSNGAGFTFDFNASGSSLSLARASVYYGQLTVASVPEPATWATLTAGLGLLLARTRRRAL